jgi:hypothetical protein
VPIRTPVGLPPAGRPGSIVGPSEVAVSQRALRNGSEALLLAQRHRLPFLLDRFSGEARRVAVGILLRRKVRSGGHHHLSREPFVAVYCIRYSVNKKTRCARNTAQLLLFGPLLLIELNCCERAYSDPRRCLFADIFWRMGIGVSRAFGLLEAECGTWKIASEYRVQ